jgi:hypothetical protein
MRRRAAILTLLCLFLSAAGAACSSILGDFDVAVPAFDAGGAPEASAPGARAAEAGMNDGPAVVVAVTSDVSVYVGQVAGVDASNSTTTAGTLAFSWKVVSAPSGSGVTTASLSGAGSASASFFPDVDGDYVVAITVSAGGQEDTANATVRATLPQVLFAQGVAGDGGGPGALYYVIADFDGGRTHPVLCPAAFSDASAPIAPFAAYAGRAYDFWEGPPGQLSKFAAFTLDLVPEAGLSGHLWAGTNASTCGGPPLDFGSAGFGPGRPFGSEPHFNDDGSRFVAFDQEWHILTFSADSADPTDGSRHLVATYPVPFSEAPSALDPVGLDAGSRYVVEPPRVEWSGDTLAWAQPTVNGWEVVTSPDEPDAAPVSYMVCPGVTPREIAKLHDGTVIASYRLTPMSSENLYQLKPDTQLNCHLEQQYTSLPDSGSSTATDFAVSPDGTQIAFLQLDTTLQDASPWVQGTSRLPGGYLYVVPVAGGTPTLVSSEPAIYGPRWIGGGTALAFTRLDGRTDSGSLATSVVVVAPDGGALQLVAQGDGVATFVSTSGNAACDATGRRPERGGWARAAACALVAAWLARSRAAMAARLRSQTDKS